MAWLTALLDKVGDAYEVTAAITPSHRIASARGAQLDRLGELVGISRALASPATAMDDTSYRQLIRSQIVKDQWDGTMETLGAIWENAFGREMGIEIVDHQDMSATMRLIGRLTPAETALAARGLIAPKPVGVRVHTVLYQKVDARVDLAVGSRVLATAAIAGVSAIDAEENEG